MIQSILNLKYQWHVFSQLQRCLFISAYIQVSIQVQEVAECCRGTTKLRSLSSWSALSVLLPIQSYQRSRCLVARVSLASNSRNSSLRLNFHRYRKWAAPEVLGHSFAISMQHFDTILEYFGILFAEFWFSLFPILIHPYLIQKHLHFMCI